MPRPRAALLLAVVLGSALTSLAAALPASAASDPATPVLPTYQVVALPGSSGRAEPRNATAPDGRLYTMTNAPSGTAIVLGSSDRGATWTKTATDIPDQTRPTSDVDLIASRTGRLIGSELDFAGGGAITFVTAYSDDQGASWHRSQLAPFAGAPSTTTTLSDTDRQWYAVGPDDPTTHLPRVYLLFHNLASGTVQHNMFVSTSVDNGATFGTPVPTTLPPQQAYYDLQCADSGGPSSISVAPSGQIYVAFGTRTSTVQQAGGCGSSVTPGPFEINVVNATRVWVATSTDGSAGSWSSSLAVDRSSTGQVVGAQLSPAAVDRQGNVYVAFPETKDGSDFTAAFKYVHAPADLSSWSAPVTVAPLADAGNILPALVAGDAGRLGFSWWHGEPAVGTDKPTWFQHLGITLDGLSAAPHISSAQVGTVPVQAGTANVLLGACGTGPAAGVENGTICSRSTDVNGVAIDPAGRLYASWPAQVRNGTDPGNNKTYVATALDGPSLYDGTPVGALPEAPTPSVLLVAAAAAVGGLAVVRRRRRSA